MGKLQLGIAGDAVQLTTTTNTDQICIGFKVLDDDAILPSDPQKKLFFKMEEDDDGNLVDRFD